MPSGIELKVVDATEVADEIVKRLACNELPPAAAELIRYMAGSSSYVQHLWLGCAPVQLRLEVCLRPDGSVRLELANCNGASLWHTTLKSPPPPPSQHVTHKDPF